MSLIAVRDTSELLAKVKLALTKLPSDQNTCKGVEIVEQFVNEHDLKEIGQRGKMTADVLERFTGYCKILKHYVEELTSPSGRLVAKDHLTISVVLFSRAEDHSIAMVQKAIKRARLVLNDAQKDKRHWLWKEGIL